MPETIERETKYQRTRERFGDDEAFLQVVADAYGVYRTTTFYLDIPNNCFQAIKGKAEVELELLNVKGAINARDLIGELKGYESQGIAKDQLRFAREGIEAGLKKLEEIAKIVEPV